jgi:tRNA U34 2-thiouridine synthase MnmA/TrmU
MKMEEKPKKTKAMVLMSGGLDSMLAAALLRDQGIEVTPFCFESYFFSCVAAKKAASVLDLPLRVVDISQEQLETVKHPQFGRGSAINSCIDCHLLMVMTAKRIMEQEGFDFVATGEVLGERPMSQNSNSLKIIEEKSGLAGRLLRPLSAKLLAETEAEKQGLVDRSRLGGISGRGRQPQMELAKKFGITYIPQPGGGCILTEKDYGQKLAKLFEIQPEADGADARLLRFGRIFYDNKTLIVVARDESECQAIKKLAKIGDLIFSPENFKGTTVLIRNFGNVADEELKTTGREYVLRFSKKAPKEAKIAIQKI